MECRYKLGYELGLEVSVVRGEEVYSQRRFPLMSHYDLHAALRCAPARHVRVRAVVTCVCARVVTCVCHGASRVCVCVTCVRALWSRECVWRGSMSH